VVFPAIVTPKTAAAASTGRFQLPARALDTVPSVNSPDLDGACPADGLAATAVVSRICSPVRLKKCWKSVPPQVATTLTTPAPRLVPWTPKYEAAETLRPDSGDYVKFPTFKIAERGQGAAKSLLLREVGRRANPRTWPEWSTVASPGSGLP
jgi:hypothetical protein